MKDRVRKAVEIGLTKWGLVAVAHAQRLILDGPKTGRIYVKGSVVHQASAPGEAPANETGRLLASLHFEITPSGTVLRVLAGTDYAAYLEFGTSKMEARPFLRRAINETSEQGLKFIREEIGKALRG